MMWYIRLIGVLGMSGMLMVLLSGCDLPVYYKTYTFESRNEDGVNDGRIIVDHPSGAQSRISLRVYYKTHVFVTRGTVTQKQLKTIGRDYERLFDKLQSAGIFVPTNDFDTIEDSKDPVYGNQKDQLKYTDGSIYEYPNRVRLQLKHKGVLVKAGKYKWGLYIVGEAPLADRLDFLTAEERARVLAIWEPLLVNAIQIPDNYSQIGVRKEPYTCSSSIMVDNTNYNDVKAMRERKAKLGTPVDLVFKEAQYRVYKKDGTVETTVYDTVERPVLQDEFMSQQTKHPKTGNITPGKYSRAKSREIWRELRESNVIGQNLLINREMIQSESDLTAEAVQAWVSTENHQHSDHIAERLRSVFNGELDENPEKTYNYDPNDKKLGIHLSALCEPVVSQLVWEETERLLFTVKYDASYANGETYSFDGEVEVKPYFYSGIGYTSAIQHLP